MNIAVIIIAYLPSPTPIETASFKQCLKVLRGHRFILACPVSLNTEHYEKVIQEVGAQVSFERFDNIWFSSVAKYNCLVRSLYFYERFSLYNYILIYQLDAWVFRDELYYWCEKGYDYIGAPWYTDSGAPLPYGGNGGFSLRKVATFIQTLSGDLEKNCRWNYPRMMEELQKISITRQPRKWKNELIELLKCRWSPKTYINLANHNEDILFSNFFSYIIGLSLPELTESFAFAFERFPEDAYRRTSGKLPFGCHAFEKYAPGFWAQWIPALRKY